MNKEKVINILKSFEYFIDDDWGGYYTNIDCSQRATTPLGILKILDYIDNLNNENTNLRQALNEIREYINSEKFFIRMDEPQISVGGVTKYELVKDDISQIIDKVLGENNVSMDKE